MVRHKALRSTVLHVKYLKPSIMRLSDRTGYLLNPLRVRQLRITVYTHTGHLKLKGPKAAHPLTLQRGQISLKYPTETFVHHITVNLISATMRTSAPAPSPLSHVYQCTGYDTAARYLRGRAASPSRAATGSGQEASAGTSGRSASCVTASQTLTSPSRRVCFALGRTAGSLITRCL